MWWSWFFFFFFSGGSDGGGWQWVANLESKSRRSRRVRESVLVVLGVSIHRMWVMVI